MEESVIGAAIRTRRRELEMTQEELESRTGIAQSYLSKVERGEIKRPSREVVVTLARELDADGEAWLQLADYSTSVAGLSVSDIDRLADAVVTKLIARIAVNGDANAA
jgi:transcriptional regulator with XRE-family HTH domain